MASSSSSSKLVSIEAILIVILASLPPKSIFRFKSVSKTWNCILVDPFFLKTYYNATRNQPVLGYHGERLLAFIGSNILNNYVVNTLTLTQKKYDVTELVPIGFGQIRHSYNGLVLCQARHSVINAIFYIINPLTRMYVILPPGGGHSCSPGLTWEENTDNLVPSYKVVQPYVWNREEKNKFVIDTYCSKSGKWEQSTLLAREDISIVLRFPLVSNGVFHWEMGIDKALVVYDSNRDEKHVQLIKCPGGRDIDSSSSATMSSCDGVLWYGSNCERREWRDPKIYFWILSKDKLSESYKYATTIEKNEWILMHTVCVQSLCSDLNVKYVPDAVVDDIKTSGLDLLALFPCHPVLAVLGNTKNIFLYNLESKCAELVPHRPSSDIRPYRSFTLIHYVESLSLSSYALCTTPYY